jgi:hypothetical protein
MNALTNAVASVNGKAKGTRDILLIAAVYERWLVDGTLP